MKSLLNFCVLLVFALAMTWEFAEVICTCKITGSTVFPVAMLYVYWLIGACTGEKKPKKKAKRPAPQQTQLCVEMRGTGWKEVR